jgi:hypothetical protein
VPSYNDPVADALEAAEAAIGLSVAIRDLDSPDASRRVLSAVSSTLWSLRQSLDHLAAWHEGSADRAITIDQPPPAGKRLARQVADDLRFAALAVARAVDHVDKGWNRNGRIVWAPTPARSVQPSSAEHSQAPAPTQRDSVGG